MRAVTAARVAWGGLALTLGLDALALVMFGAGRDPLLTLTGFEPGFLLPIIYLAFLAFPTVGAMVMFRRPGNPIGWIFLGIGLILVLEAFCLEYAGYALYVRPGSLPFGKFAAWQQNWGFLAAVYPFALLFLLFPDGRFRSARWKALAWFVLVAAMVAMVGVALAPGRLSRPLQTLSNPYAVGGRLGPIMAMASSLGQIGFTGGILVAIGCLVQRLRQARGEERQQVKWFAFGAAVAGIAFFLDGAAPPSVSSVVLNVLVVVAFAGVPVCAGIAILKHRLYDIDVVMSRTVLLGTLALFITVVYAGIVIGIGTLVGGRGSPVLSAVAAAIVAVAFQPVRQRAQRLANRLIYGKRSTPYEVLSELSERMAGTYGSEDILPRMVRILAEATGSSRADVWLRVGSEFRLAASWPVISGATAPLLSRDGDLPDFGGATRAVPVTHQGEILGALTLSKPRGEPLTPTEDRLIQDLAGQAGLVLQNVALIEDLRGSRRRIVSAQDARAKALERNIHDGAQQQLVALAIKLRLAERFVRKDDEQSRKMLAELQVDAQDALETLRDLARGIYPPLLADKGLAVALGAQAAKAQVPTTVEALSVGRYPQELESAVYFCCLEALQNIAKYARASSAAVRLQQVDGALDFVVQDDGVGFNPATTPRGSGTTNMVDRLEALGGTLEVRSRPGDGTTISGRVPV